MLHLPHPLTSSRHHPPAAAATTNPWLSFGFQRPHCPNLELFWSAATAAALELEDEGKDDSAAGEALVLKEEGDDDWTVGLVLEDEKASSCIILEAAC